MVSNTKPFLENLQKVQMNTNSNKSKNFIEMNLSNVELTLKSVREKRGSQPGTTRNNQSKSVAFQSNTEQPNGSKRTKSISK